MTSKFEVLTYFAHSISSQTDREQIYTYIYVYVYIYIYVYTYWLAVGEINPALQPNSRAVRIPGSRVPGFRLGPHKKAEHQPQTQRTPNSFGNKYIYICMYDWLVSRVNHTGPLWRVAERASNSSHPTQQVSLGCCNGFPKQVEEVSLGGTLRWVISFCPNSVATLKGFLL